jgi:hypothetical protein
MGGEYSFAAATILGAKRNWETMKVIEGFSTGEIIQM